MRCVYVVKRGNASALMRIPPRSTSDDKFRSIYFFCQSMIPSCVHPPSLLPLPSLLGDFGSSTAMLITLSEVL